MPDMPKKYRYLLTVDADTGAVDKIELVGESGDLREIPPNEFPMVPAGVHPVPVAPPSGGGNVVIHVYAGGQPPTVTTHEGVATASVPMGWPGTQTAQAASTPMGWPGTQTAQAASTPMGWPGTQTAQAASTPMGWPGTQTAQAENPSAWPGPVTQAESASAEPAEASGDEPKADPGGDEV